MSELDETDYESQIKDIAEKLALKAAADMAPIAISLIKTLIPAMKKIANDVAGKMLKDLAPALMEYKRLAENIAENLRPTIEELAAAQAYMLRRLSFSSTSRFAADIARLAKDTINNPEVVLTLALSDGADRRILQGAVKHLLKLMDNGNKALIGNPPFLVVCGETISYQELIDLETFTESMDVKPNLLAIRKAIREDLPAMISSIKSHSEYLEELEIKRGSMKERYSELPLIDFAEPEAKENTEEEAIFRYSREKLLRKFANLAAEEGWRKDRINNLLLVAKYGIAFGGFTDAHNRLGISRDTVFERRKDLRFLRDKIYKEGSSEWQR